MPPTKYWELVAGKLALQRCVLGYCSTSRANSCRCLHLNNKGIFQIDSLAPLDNLACNRDFDALMSHYSKSPCCRLLSWSATALPRESFAAHTRSPNSSASITSQPLLEPGSSGCSIELLQIDLGRIQKLLVFFGIAIPVPTKRRVPGIGASVDWIRHGTFRWGFRSRLFVADGKLRRRKPRAL